MQDGQTRRGALGSLAALAAIGSAATAPRALAQEAPAPSHPAGTELTPDEALELLKQGNAEFRMDAPYRAANTRDRRLEIAAGQKPFAVLVGCSDLRVSPEILFGRGLGELFIIRVAGNTVDLTELGSVEYAVAHLGVPLIVVLGHERCGAVLAAIEVVENNATFEGRIGDMVEPIIPAVLSVRDEPGDKVSNAVHANVRRVAGRLLVTSEIIKERVDAGEVKVVCGYYDLDDGVVEFFEPG